MRRVKPSHSLGGQVRAALDGISQADMAHIVIAYEPIWAIGTGKNASAEIANSICGMIRGTIAQLYDADTANAIRIQYGGSVKPNNMLDYMSQEHIDGGLVGGASLQVNDFVALIQASAQAKGV